MKTKNKNLVYLALIFALILAFCGALLLSVFVGEKVAFADDIGSIYNFNQLANNQSGSYSNVSFTFDSISGVTSLLGAHNVNRDAYIPFFPVPAGLENHKLIVSFDLLSNPNNLSFSVYIFNANYVLRNPSVGLHFNSLIYNSNTVHNFGFASFTPGLDFTGVSFRCQIFDLTLLGADDLSTYDLWHSVFPSTYYQYTTGSIVSPSYDQGYDDGLLVGYNDGFSSAINSFSNYNFVVRPDMFENLSDTSSIYSLIEGSYYTFSKITSVNSTTSISEVGLNVGWKDIFVTDDWNILSLSNVGFSWSIGTVSKSTNGLSYSTFNFVSSEPRFLPNNVLQLGASDPNSSRSYIQIDLEEHSGTITVPCFLSSYTTSDSVPNLYPSYQLNSLTFIMDSNLASSFADGYNNGYRAATSTVIDTSASWSAGYNAGVSSAQNTTFDSLMSAVIDVPIRTIGGLLDFNFLGINLLQFIYSLLTLGIIIAIIRLCLGKS